MQKNMYRFLSLLLLLSMLLAGCAKTDDAVDPATAEFTTDFNGGVIRIPYPQINGKHAANATLRSEAENMVWNVYEQDDTRQIDVDMAYDIPYLSDTTISVVFTGLGTVQGGAQSNHLLFARTVDLQSGSALSLSDFATVDQTFADAVFAAVAESPLHEDSEISDAMAEYLKQYSAEDWLNLLQTDPSIQSYLEKDDIVIAVPVPSVIGSWAKIRLATPVQ